MVTTLPNFVGDHLAFPIRVGGNHHGICFTEQVLNNTELFRGFRFDLQLPLRRNDRQLLQRPLLVLLAVGLGRRSFPQVADAPGDGYLRADQAVFDLPFGTEHLGDIPALGRFFAQVETHGPAPDKVSGQGRRTARWATTEKPKWRLSS